MKREPAKNTFEAWNFLWYETTVESPSALAVAFALLGFWNMDGKGRCNPSIASIMEKSRIKSKNTVKRAIEELEASGEWVAVRSNGRHSTQYYPMFVAGARKDLLAASGIGDDVEEEQDNPVGNNDVAEALVSEIPVIQETTQEATGGSDTETAEPAESAAEEFTPKVKSEKDLQLKNAHLGLVQSRKLHPDRYSVPEECLEIPILNEGEIESFGIAKGNPNRIFVSGSQGFEYLDEMPCRWVEKFGDNYGEIFTYSSIAELYESLNHKLIQSNTSNPSDYFPVDTAMWVLGADAFVPTAKAVKALIYGTKLDTRMRELQRRYEETLEGRRLTYEQNIQGLFSKKQTQYSHEF